MLEIYNLDVNLSYRGSQIKALDNLSFNVYPGEILGLVGESGAGKSMTGLAILGLIEAPLSISRGKIIFNRQRIEQNANAVRGSKISMIFQDPLVSLNPLRTIGEQLVETIRTHIKFGRKEALKAAEAAAAKYGFALEEITGGNQRGGGKKQKAAAKYRNPNNPEETWSGRGRKPHWVHAALTAGMDISDLEI